MNIAIHRQARAFPDFAPTEFMFNHGEAALGDFADTVPGFDFDAQAASREAIESARRGAALAVEADQAWHRARVLRTAAEPVRIEPVPRNAWLGRMEAAVLKWLPGGFSGLLGLFLCVSMSIVLLSAMLPLVDRV